MITVRCGDWIEQLKGMPDESVHCCVTSPPYWGLRDYGVSGQLGLERTPNEYVAKMVEGFREVRRVLRKDGVLFLNLGDTYAGYHGNKRVPDDQAPSNKPGYVENMRASSVTSRRGRALRVASYDTSGKAPEGSQESGCLCGSLCDACRVAYRIGKSHNGSRPSAMPTASPSVPSREHTESAPDRLPTSDCSIRADRSGVASSDRGKTSGRAGEQPPVSPQSMLRLSSEQSQGACLQAESRGAKCLLCARTLSDCVPQSVCMSGEIREISGRTEGTVSPCAGQEQNTQYTCDYCFIGDSHRDYTTAYLKPKDLCGIPWMVAFALRADSWYLRQDIIWAKTNPMPESVRDRCTKSHEHLFLLSKSERYYFDQDAIKEPSVTNDIRRPYTSEGAWQMDGRPIEQRHGGELRNGRGGKNAFRGQGANRDSDTGPANRNGRDMKDIGIREFRNKRDVWVIGTKPYPEAHFATFPPKLVEPCVLAGCPPNGTVLDPFAGSGTVGQVCNEQGRNAILIELSEKYIPLINARCGITSPTLVMETAAGV